MKTSQPTPSSTATAGNMIALLGLVLIVVGTLLPLLRVTPLIYRIIYSAGALCVLAGRIMAPYRGSSLRLQRLHRIEMWSGIIFCVGAFFMFYQGSGNTDWIAFTLAGGVLYVYTSIMIPRQQDTP